MAAGEVPPALGRLWRMRSASRLGRPAELDVDQVVRAAVELADRDGLAAVTLSRVAKELDCTTMALYRHVGSKDELYVLMGDLAAGAPPAVDTADWRDGLRQWALADRAVIGSRMVEFLIVSEASFSFGITSRALSAVRMKV